jgi:polyphosphate:AMP phosphotransferase
MFENAELGNRVDKETFRKEMPKLREKLLHAQQLLPGSGLGVVILFGGVEGGGKSEAADTLLAWLDARGVETWALSDPTDEERERPPMWRFWRRLPPRGRTAVLLGSWYSQPIADRVAKRIRVADLDQHLDRIADFERMLTSEGLLLVKIWLHLSRNAQRERLRRLEADRETRWRVTARDWKDARHYDRYRNVAERVLRRTSLGEAPWHIVEAADARFRDRTVGETVLHALEERLAELKARPAAGHVPDRPRPPAVSVLRRLDLRRKLDDEEYERQLPRRQAQLNELTRRLHEQGRSMILVFEGPDAAGKGGAIRRLTAAMDARDYQHIAVSAPTDEERAHPYLWRFWRHLPRQGRVTIYDRSWYGRVLVERIEGFCTRDEWERAFGEINAFEEQLAESGTIVVKFWLQISPREQLRRFRNRLVTPYKQYKLTEEDWRNRGKWNAYQAAACEMIERTGTDLAPWVPVEAEDKNWARIRVLKTVVRTLRRELA